MKICCVKQDVYQDLYVGDNNISKKELLFSSMMRVGPFALIYDLSGDFYIIKEENTEECQTYNQFLRGFGGNYKKLKTDLLNTIPGNHFFEPGSDKPNGYYAVGSENIQWDDYDIVISINFSIPSNIVKKHHNILWCYLIGENNLHLLDSPKYDYDIALNQDLITEDYDMSSSIIYFPYTFLSKDTLSKLFINNTIVNSIFIEINSCRDRPVKSCPELFNKISNDFSLDILVHNQNIKNNLINLQKSKYFVKFGGRNIRGNSVIEAISSNTLVIMDKTKTGYDFLIPDECNITTEHQLYNKIKYFQENETEYQNCMNYQKNILQKYCYEKPLEHIYFKWHSKINKAVVFVSNIPYFGNFLNSLEQLINVGKYTDDIVLIAADDLYNSPIINNEKIKKYNVKVVNYPDIKKIMSDITVKNIHDYYGPHGKKNYNWAFGCFNKFHLFNTYFKRYKYILYLDTGIKIYRPIWDMFTLINKNKILAHHDDFPRYHYKLADKFRDIEPYKTKIKEEFDMNTTQYFQTTIMLYDTSIINDDTVKNIINLVDKYPISCNGDQEYISLYFHQVMKQMNQITLNKNYNYYYYDYYQRFGIKKYCMTKI